MTTLGLLLLICVGRLIALEHELYLIKKKDNGYAKIRIPDGYELVEDPFSRSYRLLKKDSPKPYIP